MFVNLRFAIYNVCHMYTEDKNITIPLQRCWKHQFLASLFHNYNCVTNYRTGDTVSFHFMMIWQSLLRKVSWVISSLSMLRNSLKLSPLCIRVVHKSYLLFVYIEKFTRVISPLNTLKSSHKLSPLCTRITDCWQIMCPRHIAVYHLLRLAPMERQLTLEWSRPWPWPGVCEVQGHVIGGHAASSSKWWDWGIHWL